MSDWFFSKWFWLPEKFKWEDFENRPGDDTYIAQPRDLIYCIPVAFSIFFIRIIFERFVITRVFFNIGRLLR